MECRDQVSCWAVSAVDVVSEACFAGTAEQAKPGTFIYSPAAGTVLPVGNGQTLAVTMVDTLNTYAASATTTIDVTQPVTTPAQLVVTPSFTRDYNPDDPLGFLTLWLTIANKGGKTASQVKFTTVKIGTTVIDISGNNIPQNIASGTIGTFNFNPPNNVAAPKSAVVVTWSGTYAGSTFSGSARVTLP